VEWRCSFLGKKITRQIQSALTGPVRDMASLAWLGKL
jgi:hypothetical protein